MTGCRVLAEPGLGVALGKVGLAGLVRHRFAIRKNGRAF
jgi:hypothetical protein